MEKLNDANALEHFDICIGKVKAKSKNKLLEIHKSLASCPTSTYEVNMNIFNISQFIPDNTDFNTCTRYLISYILLNRIPSIERFYGGYYWNGQVNSIYIYSERENFLTINDSRYDYRFYIKFPEMNLFIQNKYYTNKYKDNNNIIVDSLNNITAKRHNSCTYKDEYKNYMYQDVDLYCDTNNNSKHNFSSSNKYDCGMELLGFRNAMSKFLKYYGFNEYFPLDV